MAALSLAFGIIGNLISIGLFLSPVPTFRRICKQKDTQEFSWLPYVVTLMNCLLWVWYGLPWVVTNIPVLTINVAGVVLQLSYILIYLRYTVPKKKVKLLLSLALITLFVAIVVVVTVWVMKGGNRKLFVGILCVIFTIGMNVAPLSIMRLVITTRSVEYMPFYLSLFVFINGCAWFIYGLLTSDIFVLIPNALGALLGAMQLILYAIYSRTTPKVAQGKEGQKPDEKNLTPAGSKTDVELTNGANQHPDNMV